MNRERTLLDDMSDVGQATLAEVRALRREVDRMAATIAEAQAALAAFKPLVEQLIAENQALRASTDTTPLITDITALQSEVQAVLPSPAAPAESAPPTDGGQQIDPNTGQPVQPV